MPRFKPLLAAMLATLMFGILAPGAFAQSRFPNRPIRLLVPFAPGGGVDVVARIVGQKLSERIGQPILVESKPGAGGVIAVNELMRADPDGYTLLMTTSSHATLPAFAKLPWHPSSDFAPIEFINYAKANPGKISWGSSGIAGPQHLAGAQFAKAAGLDMVHVPYRGNGPMLQALLQNDVQLTFDTPTLVTPHVQDGKLIALAVTGEQRLDKLPSVPTVRETNLVDFSNQGRIFVLATKGTPEPVQAFLNKEFAEALDTKEVNDRLVGLGLTVPKSRENTVANLKNHIDDFAAVYGKLIAEMGIKAE